MAGTRSRRAPQPGLKFPPAPHPLLHASDSAIFAPRSLDILSQARDDSHQPHFQLKRGTGFRGFAGYGIRVETLKRSMRETLPLVLLTASMNRLLRLSGSWDSNERPAASRTTPVGVSLP